MWLVSTLCYLVSAFRHNLMMITDICLAVIMLGFPGGSDNKEFACNAGDLGSIPGFPWRRERLLTAVFWPGEFHGPVHGVAKSQTRLSDFHFSYVTCKALYYNVTCTTSERAYKRATSNISILQIEKLRINQLKIFIQGQSIRDSTEILTHSV